MIIRGLSTGDLEFSDLPKVVWKEFRVALMVGTALSLVNFARILLLHQASTGIAVAVSLTLMGTVIIAKLLGGSLPILADKLGVDPAIMASPLITTIVDASTLIIYFTIAKQLLGL